MDLIVSEVEKEPKYRNLFVIHTQQGRHLFSQSVITENIVSHRQDSIKKAIEVLEGLRSSDMNAELLLEEYAEDAASTEDPELYILNEHNLPFLVDCSVDFKDFSFHYTVSYYDEAGFEYAVDIEH